MAFTYEKIKRKIEERGYTLLSTVYKNTDTKLEIICPNGHKRKTTYRLFRRGKRCKLCFAESRRLNKEFIKNQIECEGYTLLNIYKGNNKPIYYVCPNGHEGSITWVSWQQNGRCKKCSIQIAALKLRHDYVFVKSTFDAENYILLTNNYYNAKQKLEYICPYGHKGKTTFSNWYNHNRRCNICSIINISGPNSPSWRGGIAKEPYCVDWIFEFKEYIKERDSYKCLNPYCKKTSKRLAVHHIDYVKKNCNHTNLITLCTGCNSSANVDREWHTAWYQAILNKRYGYIYL
jgi:hypothetical protein